MELRYDLRKIGLYHEDDDLDAHEATKLLIKEVEKLQEENLKLRKQLWDSSWPTMRNEKHNPYKQKDSK